MSKIVRSAACALAFAAFQPLASFADPISYIYTGIGSGSLAGVAFSNAGFTITGLADTNNIVPAQNGEPIYNEHLQTRIAIDGVGTVSIFESTSTYVLEGCCGGFGKTLLADWIGIDAPEFVKAGYRLDTALDPVTDASPTNTFQFVNVPTSGGVLSMPVISTVTFRAVTAVPEPASLLLWAMGISVVLSRRAWRTLRTSPASL